MLQVNINNRYYELPFGELYRDSFSPYINGDAICLDKLDNKLKYKKTYELFNRVTEGINMYLKDNDEYIELNRKVSPVDNLQKFYYKKGNINKSILLMNNLMEEMLKYYNKFISDDVNKKRGL